MKKAQAPIRNRRLDAPPHFATRRLAPNAYSTQKASPDRQRSWNLNLNLNWRLNERVNLNLDLKSRLSLPARLNWNAAPSLRQ